MKTTPVTYRHISEYPGGFYMHIASFKNDAERDDLVEMITVLLKHRKSINDSTFSKYAKSLMFGFDIFIKDMKGKNLKLGVNKEEQFVYIQQLSQC